MNRFSILVLVFFTSSLGLSGQINNDFIIIVNDELKVGALSNLRFTSKNETGEVKEVSVEYYPGNLSFESSEYELLFSDPLDSIFIAFDYNEFCNNDHNIYNYEIPFSESWLDHSFLILRVYNLKSGKYKNVFDPLSGSKNYTFELDYPGGSMKRVKARRVRNKKKCR